MTIVPEKVAVDLSRLITVIDFSCTLEKVGSITFRQLYTYIQFLSISYLNRHFLTPYIARLLTSSMKPLKYPTKMF